jgi:hypothetical protein
MTESSPSRPVPGPPRPGPRPDGAAPAPQPETQPDMETEGTGPSEDRFADLAERPIAEHVAVYEAEHARLERELGTIDQL